ISSVPDQSTDEDTPTSAIPFSIGDVEATAGSLTVTARSSNQEIGRASCRERGGSEADATLTLAPATNQSGTARITITFADLDGASTSSLSVLSVNAVNDPTAISSVRDQSTDEDTPTAAIPFSIADAETTAGSLMVTARSSNQ